MLTHIFFEFCIYLVISVCFKREGGFGGFIQEIITLENALLSLFLKFHFSPAGVVSG